MEHIRTQRQYRGLFRIQRISAGGEGKILNQRLAEQKEQSSGEKAGRRAVVGKAGMSMAVEKITGIVLREIPVGESDKRIVILTKEHGKMLLFARGARKAKSKFMAACQLFCISEFLYLEKAGFRSVTQAQLKESFYGIRKDIIKLAYASYFMELIENTVLEGMEAGEIFDFSLRALWVMAREDSDPYFVDSVFELKYMVLSGFQPEVSCCARCGKEERVYFDVQAGGTVCRRCGRGMPLMKGTVRALQYIVEADIKRVFSFRVSPQVEKELRQVVRSYVDSQLQERLPALQFALGLKNT